MAHQLEFADDFPQIIPDPPTAGSQFSVKWKCINTGDADSPELGIRVDVLGADGVVLLTSIGRSVAALRPGETDDDTLPVGAVGSGSGTVRVTVGGVGGGVSAVIPITVR